MCTCVSSLYNVEERNQVEKMFERIDYIVTRIDGDYAYLIQIENQKTEEKCVARALLPESIMTGSKLKYEMMQYELLE